jgi:hypothetical protein
MIKLNVNGMTLRDYDDELQAAVAVRLDDVRTSEEVVALINARPNASESSQSWDRRKFGGARARAVFSRLFSDQGWTRGLDCEAGANRG